MFGLGRLFGRSQKKKLLLVRKYRANTSGGARKKMERDAEKLMEQGYRLDRWDDKSHWYGRRGDITATFILTTPAALRLADETAAEYPEGGTPGHHRPA